MGGEHPSSSDPSEESESYLYAFNLVNSKDGTFATITINRQIQADFKTDTGAQANLILQHYLNMLYPRVPITSHTLIWFPYTFTWNLTRKEHDDRLEEVLKHSRKSGIKSSKRKCQLGLEMVCYFGHVISKDGIKPDPKKFRVFNDNPKSYTKEEHQTLLGKLNVIFRCIPDISSKNKPRRDLLKEESFDLQ
ncbi:hypothetical protein QYM36_014804 [Artemia franciscana]|uniref:Uncharacterized protein n=1 Tax=Artemia franciscana TaxID=6661 RepID=A0AA88KYL4_ARTSF|nr:hypothetical protein QYM36_014804 [Artemia franciscana]